MAEHILDKGGVTGSSPVGATSKILHFVTYKIKLLTRFIFYVIVCIYWKITGSCNCYNKIKETN